MTILEPETTPPALEETVDHWLCCASDQTFCGSPVGASTEDEDVDPNCVVCLDLEERGVCPVTGTEFNSDLSCPGPPAAGWLERIRNHA